MRWALWLSNHWQLHSVFNSMFISITENIKVPNDWLLWSIRLRKCLDVMMSLCFVIFLFLEYQYQNVLTYKSTHVIHSNYSLVHVSILIIHVETIVYYLPDFPLQSNSYCYHSCYNWHSDSDTSHSSSNYYWNTRGYRIMLYQMHCEIDNIIQLPLNEKIITSTREQCLYIWFVWRLMVTICVGKSRQHTAS